MCWFDRWRKEASIGDMAADTPAATQMNRPRPTSNTGMTAHDFRTGWRALRRPALAAQTR